MMSSRLRSMNTSSTINLTKRWLYQSQLPQNPYQDNELDEKIPTI